MKNLAFIIVCIFSVFTVAAQSKKNAAATPDSTKKIQLVDASCGQCQFGLHEQKGCDLAVRINGKAYFVDGTTIDDHGDAHARDGFCEAIRKAEVQGEIVKNRFKATYFKLIPEKDEVKDSTEKKQ